MQIFSHSDEINVLLEFLEDHRDIKGIRSKLAAAAGCQLSYLSQAMAGKVHLTPDHGYGIARFMQLNQEETDYFLLLIQFKRAGNPEHRTYLNKKIQLVRKANFKLESKIQAGGKISEADLQRYYSDWLMQAIHMYLTIPKYQRLTPLARKLSLTELDVSSYLDKLVTMGLAAKAGDAFTAILKDLHVPLRSPHSLATQTQWKLRALQDLQKRESPGVHYVATFSLSENDIEKLKAMIIDFIAETRELARSSPEEEVAHLSVSFFPL